MTTSQPGNEDQRRLSPRSDSSPSTTGIDRCFRDRRGPSYGQWRRQDEALPDPIRSQLARQLPAFMQIYSQRLAKLARPPMLFVSYDVSPYEEKPDSWGSQGGVLPGQIFIHFYGARWPEKEPGSEYRSPGK